MMNSLQLAKAPADTIVVVAMSGGVDSSVVAAMLHDEGYKVIGVTLQLYDHGAAIHRKGACCAGQDIYDAKMVADKMGFAHYVLNYEERFKKSVIDPFAQSYVDGETPLPCASCNQTVKFKDLLEVAKDLGADVLATGHYVQTKLLENGDFALYRPHDLERDQSYFLYGTTQEQLRFVRFPLGGKPKADVRKMAEKFGLEIADKPDSQDICFVPTGHYSAIVEKLRPEASEPGEIVHIDGRVMGQHKGILHYTIGQRKGLGLALGEPVYVVSLDAQSRRVVVGPREALAMRDLVLREVNWLGDVPLSSYGDEGLEVMVRVRSTRPAKPARIFAHELGARISLSVDEEGVAPGQAAVFYEDDSDRSRVLGGGIITKTPPIEALKVA